MPPPPTKILRARIFLGGTTLLLLLVRRAAAAESCVAIVDASASSTSSSKCASAYARDLAYASPREQAAGVRCCDDAGGQPSSVCDEGHTCELVEYATAQQRCAALGRRLCSAKEVLGDYAQNATTSCGFEYAHVWTSTVTTDCRSSEEPANECYKAVASRQPLKNGAADRVRESLCPGSYEGDDVLKAGASERKAGIRCCSDDSDVRGVSYCKRGMCELYTWHEARDVCDALGMRLCSAFEIMVNKNEIAGTGCMYDGVPIWSSTPCEPAPSGAAVLPAGARPVDHWGSLRVDGTALRAQNGTGEEVQLMGMSFFWSNANWGGRDFYKDAVVESLAKDWGVTVLRVPTGVDNFGGLMFDWQSNERVVRDVVKAAIKYGIYVIVDFHSHHAHRFQEEALTFFESLARDYGSHPNVLWEIYNEPLPVTHWTTIKPYAETMVAMLRKYSQNLVIVGTRAWCQHPFEASQHPVSSGSNVAYSVHFYAGVARHGLAIQEDIKAAHANGAAVFASEWGMVDYNGDGDVNEAMSREWLDFLDAYRISWTNWAFHAKREGSSALKHGAPKSPPWDDHKWLAPSGLAIKDIIQHHHTRQSRSSASRA